MIKAVLFIALALTLCQAMPSSFNSREMDSNDESHHIREVAERIFEESNRMDQRERSLAEEEIKNSVFPVKRDWMETVKGSVVPLITVRREFIREWAKLSNDSVRDVREEENLIVRRVWNSMSEQEKREFVEPSRIAEFEEKTRQFSRDFQEVKSSEEDFSRRDLNWTNEIKRVWTESSNGTVIPMKRDEFERYLNESVVVPVNREWIEQAAAEKREFLEMVRKEFNTSVPEVRAFGVENFQGHDLIRNSRSLSDEEIRSQNVSEFVKMCDGSSQFKYYQPHPQNESLYIQCDPWGQPIVKACEEGLIWDQWRLRCCTPENVKNTTRAGYEFDLLKAVESLFDCNLPQYTCVNGGVCSKLTEGYKCVCSGNFTGDLCEIRVESSSIFSELLSGKFSFEQYREKLVKQGRHEEELRYFEQFRSSLSPSTYEALVKYLSGYKNEEVRYDRLVSNIIEDVLEDIYPDAFYLSVFNASAESVANVVRMVPNLLSYAKYSSDRYVQVFYQYQKALDNLVQIFNGSWPTVEREAAEYYKLTSLYLNNSAILANQTEGSLVRPIEVREGSVEQDVDGTFSFGSRPVPAHKSGLAGGAGPVEWTDVQVMDKMKSELNETIPSQEELFGFLEKFRVRALEEIKRDQKVVSLPLGEAQFELSKETIAKFDEIARSSSEVWQSLCNYGFWFLTNLFAKQF